jgi:Rrf2 family protein
MRLSDGVEWGVHCGVLLGFVAPDGALPTARLAEYHGVPAAYLAKHLQAMSRAGLLESVQGPKGGYRLARPATEITVLEVVEAIDGDEPAFRCAEIRRRGPTARPAREYKGMCGVHAAMNRADAAWRAELRTVTLADLMVSAVEGAPAKSLEVGVQWIQEAVR